MRAFYKSLIYTVAISITLSACSMLSPVKTPNTNTYVLDAQPQVKVQRSQNPKTLLVMTPETNPLYNNTNMLYTTYPYQIDQFALNRWADTPTRMMLIQLIQTLHKTRHFKAVVTPPYVGAYDYVLNTQLVELQQDFTVNPSVIHLIMRVQILNASTNRIISAKEYNINMQTPENTPYGGVIASNQAMKQVLRQIAAQCMV